MNDFKIEPNTAYYNNLNDLEKKTYLKLYMLYSNLLYKFLIPRLELNIYERMMVNER